MKKPSQSLPPPLLRPFRIIGFDWDGTAVENRHEDARAVQAPIERLLECGVLVFVVTGTNFANMDRQLARHILGPHKQNLFFSTQRGSEIWGFTDQSAPVLRWARTPTPEEDRALTEIAERVRAELVARTGLEIGLVYDRLNRRKIDLIPLPSWSDPPKSAMRELEWAVQKRLKEAGLAGGLREAIDIAMKAIADSAIPMRVTSDRKHIEIGLTDKSDALRWMATELMAGRGIRPEDVLIVGDELGPVAGLPGSDSFMMIPEVRGAVFASVGPEPGGVPEGVIRLGGGPARFRHVLQTQAALHPLGLLATRTEDHSWLLVDQGLTLAREHEIESVFAIGNGYMGSRASLAEGGRQCLPGTFLAGVYENRAPALPELARLWDWANVRVRGAHGSVFALEPGRYVVNQRVLDLRNAILWRDWDHVDHAAHATHFRSMRLASLADRHLLVDSVLFEADNYAGDLLLESSLPAVPVHTETWGAQRLVFFELPVEGSDVKVAFAVLVRVVAHDGAPIVPEVEVAGALGVMHCEVRVEPRRAYRLDRIVCVVSSRDAADPALAARREIERAVVRGLPAIVEAHTKEWDKRWQSADVRLDGDLTAQRALRFAAYHLVSAASPTDEHASVGARALTGGTYGGHVFWDTEIYMLPFYTLTAPEVARSLLMYRFHTLPAARARAQERGYRGALYAWESADTGEDVTPPFVKTPAGDILPVVCGEQEHHISADVAYGVWSYWHATQDEAFMMGAGAEIIFETARFWASRATLADDGRYHIVRVQGPDEYHEAVDDNAYTNGMARWNLEQGVVTARLLMERWPAAWRELASRLGLHEAEAEAWRDIADRMYFPLDPKTGLIEQFRGYFDLEDIALDAFLPRTAPVDVILGRERTQRSKIIKQADVVLLIYLLWDRFSPEVRDANFRYYEPRTAHGSSLSPSIHALVAARLGHADCAKLYFEQAATIDLADNMGNAAGGVHAAALGGLWQSAVFGFAGVELRSVGPAATPHLAEQWGAMHFTLLWRGKQVAVDVCGDHAEVLAQPLMKAAS